MEEGDANPFVPPVHLGSVREGAPTQQPSKPINKVAPSSHEPVRAQKVASMVMLDLAGGPPKTKKC